MPVNRILTTNINSNHIVRSVPPLATKRPKYNTYTVVTKAIKIKNEKQILVKLKVERGNHEKIEGEVTISAR